MVDAKRPKVILLSSSGTAAANRNQPIDVSHKTNLALNHRTPDESLRALKCGSLRKSGLKVPVVVSNDT